MLQIFDTQIGTAEENMRLDERLLENLEAGGDPILHLYQWDGNSATFGYFIDPRDLLNLTQAAKWNLSLARRPTGGGIIFHIWDFAFSFLMPSGHPLFSENNLENYRFVNTAVLEVVQSYFHLAGIELTPAKTPGAPDFCMARPTQYDVICGGRKIAGSAQRRKKQGYLHQGTISLTFPDVALLRDVLLSEELVEKMQSCTFAPVKVEELPKVRLDLKHLLREKLMEKTDVLNLQVLRRC